MYTMNKKQWKIPNQEKTLSLRLSVGLSVCLSAFLSVCPCVFAWYNNNSQGNCVTNVLTISFVFSFYGFLVTQFLRREEKANCLSVCFSVRPFASSRVCPFVRLSVVNITDYFGSLESNVHNEQKEVEDPESRKNFVSPSVGLSVCLSAFPSVCPCVFAWYNNNSNS